MLFRSALVGVAEWSVTSGHASIFDVANPQSNVNDLIIGTSVLTWTITNGVCPSSTDEVAIHLNPFAVPNGFSPDGDGINDNFVIQGLAYYSAAVFKVFDRWGDIVYKNDTYKNDWNGVNKNNEPLVDDTYYYTLELSSGDTFSGFILIKRTK